MSSSPGWYDDPDGAPGRQRWWNGGSWSELTQARPGAAHDEASSSYGVLEMGHPDRPSRPRPWLPWMIVAAAALVVVLAVSLLISSRGTTSVADPPVAVPSGPSGSTGPTWPSGPTLAPGTTRIVDPSAGISYAYLGDGWQGWDFPGHGEMSSVHGQYIVTQESVPGGGEFIAECSSGPLGGQFPVGGPQDYPAAIEAVANSFRANYYPAPNTRQQLRSEPVTVAGRPGYLLQFDLSWDIAGYDSTGERVTLLLLDAGRPRPALLYISIPDTHGELYGVIDEVLGSVELV